MKRYQIVIKKSFGGCLYHIEESPNGTYVRYEDVKDFIDMAYHKYDPRPDSKRCRVFKENEEHAMHHWIGEDDEKI